MRIFVSKIAITVSFVVVPLLLLASTPKIITYSSQNDFEKGKAKGVSINNLGQIRLGPAISEIFEPEIPFLWTAVADAQGNLFVAGGNSGEVYKIDSDGQGSSFFKTEGQQIYAMAVDAANNVFVATSPKGKVYKVPPGGSVAAEDDVFFEPEDVYIWSMVLDRDQNLYVATGEKGKIYKVASGGKASLFYESEDSHIREMVFDRDGNLLAGTSDKGLIIKIDAKGQPFVLYDSPLVEVTDLVVDSKRNIYVAVSGESRVPRVPSRPPSSSSEKSENNSGGDDEDAIQLPQQDISSRRTGRFGQANSELYRIEPDGTVQTFWDSKGEQIFALAVSESDRIVLGTGDPAKLYLLTGPDEHTLLNEFDEEQTTAIEASQPGRLFVCTSNSGRVYRTSTTYSSSGEYLSDVIDASVHSRWGEIHWEAELLEGTKLTFSSRSGNTEEPDKSWSPWSSAYSDASGQNIVSPAARFLQLRATLSTSDGQLSPILKEFTFSYLQKNIAPRVEEITLHSPGEYYPEAANNRSANSHLGNGQAQGNNGGSGQSPGRKSFQKGYRTVSWKTHDENNDKLTYDLFYKGVDESSWKTLVEDFHGRVFSWDSELFPDGHYLIKVVAEDNLSNPPGTSLSTERTSQPFKVDNSGPEVGEITVDVRDDAAQIQFSVLDKMTNITSVEYGINADEWKLVYPVDGICDSKSERFEFRSRSYVKGENTIVIKAIDALGNFGYGKAKIIL